MNFSEITPYVVAANFVLTWGIGFYVHLINKNKATNDRLDLLDGNLNTVKTDHTERLGRVEGQLKGVPTHDDLGKVYRELNETAQQVSRLTGEISQMNDNLRMLLHNMGESRQHVR